jgi:hypothetical protein
VFRNDQVREVRAYPERAIEVIARVAILKNTDFKLAKRDLIILKAQLESQETVSNRRPGGTIQKVRYAKLSKL